MRKIRRDHSKKVNRGGDLMALQYFYEDLITISISYALFWIVILILILYPSIRLRKTLKRIKTLEKNIDLVSDEKI